MPHRPDRKAEVLTCLPGTQFDIVGKLGMGRSAVGRYLRELHNEGLCQVTATLPDKRGRMVLKYYEVGKGKR